jgi:MinD-like ATPase involved in chromosome partitioning or flagellar assembly
MTMEIESAVTPPHADADGSDASGVFAAPATQGDPTEHTAVLWAIGGGKGGVGKSVVAANLAIAVARRGHTVWLVDADLGGGNQHTLFGVARPRRTLEDFLSGRVRSLAEVALPTRYKGLSLVSAQCDVLGSANPKHAQKLKLIRHLRAAPADVVIIDLGAGTSFNTLDLFLAATVQIVVTNTEPTALQNAYGFVKCAAQRSTDDVNSCVGYEPRIVVNSCSRREDAARTFAALCSVTEKVLGERPSQLPGIRHDSSIAASVREGTPLAALSPSSPVARDIEAIVDELMPAEEARPTPAPEVAPTPADKPMGVRGVNEDLRVSDRLLHVQTEDLGADKSQIRTQVFEAGRVIFTKITPYDAPLKKGTNLSRQEHINFQHRAVAQAIRSGRVA